ncbi:MAG: Na/Pi cotransporter family protein [Chitinophagales bacterium]
MEITFGILKLCAGIGLFLFGIYLLEESLKHLSGRNFKIFLQRIAKNPIGAVLGGAIVTAVLQSSSLVSLMVLAFVGAGVFNMKNALAIILGANLGTTIDSWLVAMLGFKVNVEVAAYPVVFAGGLLLILFNNRQKIKHLSFFLLGFGLLFIGLALMKTAMEAHVQDYNLAQYAEMPLIIFLFIGFLLTLIVQSSSVTMALTLSAIHAGAIGFEPAAAIVLGSETGTTIKIMLGAIGGNATKKRVVFGNFLFNVTLTVFAFIFLKQILFLITNSFKITDPLIGLVTFSTLTNLLGIAVFLPLLNSFVKFLDSFFKESDISASAYIGNAKSAETETAIDLVYKETEYFIRCCLLFNLSKFGIGTNSFLQPPDFKGIIDKKKFTSQTPEEQYEYLKELQGELQAFYLKLRAKLSNEQNSQLNQGISAVRSAMHSVKSMKDIDSNISDLRRSSKDIKFDFFMKQKKATEELYHQFYQLMGRDKIVAFEAFQQVYDDILNNYITSLNNFYKEAQSAQLEDMDLTTVINFNREHFTSNKAMLVAIKDFILNEKEAEDFNEMMNYKT